MHARSALWGILVVLVLSSVIGWFGHVYWFFDLFSHFRAQYLAGSAVCAVAFSAIRERVGVRVALVLATTQLILIVPHFAAWPSAGASGHASLRLVLVNVNHWNRDYERTRAFLSRVEPDVLLLEEVDAAWMDALDDVMKELPFGLEDYRSDPFGIALRSRYPVDGEVRHLSERNPSILGEIRTPTGALSFVGTHPFAPTSPERAQLRDDQLRQIAAWSKSKTRSGPVVVLGDLNTTSFGQAFRALLTESGLRDASRGRRFTWSWPSSFWPFAITIDHCLVSDDIEVIDRRIGPNVGSDHYPLIVDIAL